MVMSDDDDETAAGINQFGYPLVFLVIITSYIWRTRL